MFQAVYTGTVSCLSVLFFNHLKVHALLSKLAGKCNTFGAELSGISLPANQIIPNIVQDLHITPNKEITRSVNMLKKHRAE